MELFEKIENAAMEDDKSLTLKRPGLKKLQMLPEVLDAMIQRVMMRPLLFIEADFLIIGKKWIQPFQPLENGLLGNDHIAKINDDFSMDNDDWKKVI